MKIKDLFVYIEMYERILTFKPHIDIIKECALYNGYCVEGLCTVGSHFCSYLCNYEKQCILKELLVSLNTVKCDKCNRSIAHWYTYILYNLRKYIKYTENVLCCYCYVDKKCRS